MVTYATLCSLVRFGNVLKGEFEECQKILQQTGILDDLFISSCLGAIYAAQPGARRGQKSGDASYSGHTRNVWTGPEVQTLLSKSKKLEPLVSMAINCSAVTACLWLLFSTQKLQLSNESGGHYFEQKIESSVYLSKCKS